MAEHTTRTHDEFEDDPRVRRMVEYLKEGPLPGPSAEALDRAKQLGARRSAPQPGLVQHLVETIATLFVDSRATPALAGFRSASTEARLIFRSPSGEIELQIEPAPAGQGAPMLIIMGCIDTRQHARLASLLQSDGTIVAREVIDEHGMFELTAPPGKYQLMIALEECTIRIPSIEL